MRARDLILKPQKRQPCTVKALDGETDLSFALVLLPAEAQASVVTKARDYAKAQGGTGAVEDPQFLRGKYAYGLLASAVDVDSPIDQPVPYFDDLAQLQRMMDDAWIAFAFEKQQDFQSEYAPPPGNLRPEDFTVLIGASTEAWKTGGDPERPFVGLRPAELRSLSATLALRCTTLTQLLSPPGLPTAGTSDESESSSDSVLTSEKPS